MDVSTTKKGKNDKIDESQCVFEVFPWNLMQTNSQTLTEPAKISSYENQTLRRRIHISAWQETRTPKKGVHDAGGFVKVHAPAIRGQFGVEIWFNKKLEINDWFLYSIDSPITRNARGFSRGSIFSKSGELVASCAQEGLIRLWPEKK